MKLRHWINLIVVVGGAVLLTWLALHWAITSYVEPTCRAYAASNGMTYVSYTPLDPSINASRRVNEGDCQMRTSNGDPQTVSLPKASGTNYGAPLLVGLALQWHLVFIASFFAVALVLFVILRVVTGKRPS